jgi:transcriptional regulator with XRE-family HTH domain
LAVNQIDIEVGQRINELIESQDNVSSRQFAMSIGMDPSQFAKIVKGIAAISLEKLVEISSKYQVSIEWLVTGEMTEEKHAFAEGEAGYIKEPAPVKMPVEVLVLLKNEIATMQSSLNALSKVVSGNLPEGNTGDHQATEDLRLDKKKRILKDGKKRV